MDAGFECAEYEVAMGHSGRGAFLELENNLGWRYVVEILTFFCNFKVWIHSTILNVYYVLG